MPRSPRHRRFHGGLILLTAALLGTHGSEASEVHVFTASDLLNQPTLTTGQGSGLQLSLWIPAEQSWSARVEGDRLMLTLDRGGFLSAPTWQTLPDLKLRPNTDYKLFVGDSHATSKPDDQTSPAQPAPLPALLVVATEAYDRDLALALIRSRLDTLTTPNDNRLGQVRTNQTGVDFHAPDSLPQWQNRARQLREQLMVTLGQWPEWNRGNVVSTVVGTIVHEDYVIERIRLRTLSGFDLSGDLYRPRGVEGRLPTVLSPHGHWAEGRLNVDVQHRCIGLAKLGCLVFMYNMVGYNESKPFGHTFQSPRLNRWGFSLASLQTWNSRRVLDWLLARPDVDPTRIACTGESGGGTQTFLLTAIDDRVKVSAPVVMVSEGFQGGCGCENSPGLRWATDNVEFAALCAPRPLKLVGATGDWTSNTTSHTLPVLRGVYSLFGVPDRISADVFTAPHNYNQTSRNAVYAFLAHWLLDIDDPLRTIEGPQSTESGEALLTYDSEHPVSDDLKSPAELEDFLVASRAEEIARMRPSTFPAEWDAHRRYLQRILEVRLGLTHPAASDINYREIRRTDLHGLSITHAVLEREGDAVPIVSIEKPGPTRRTVLLTHHRGKSALLDDLGELAALPKSLAEAGFRVITFDPLLIGENLDPASPSRLRPETVHSETYNRSLAADRIRDLETVVTWAAAQRETLTIDLIADGQMGPLALLALPGLNGIGRSFIDLEGFDYGDGNAALPAGLDLAGVLQFGGLEVALALAAPRTVSVAQPGPGFQRLWAENAYGMAGAASQVRISPGHPGTEGILQWITAGP